MKIISLKLPDVLEAQLTAAARRTGRSKSAIVRDALARYLLDGRRRIDHSFLARAEDLAGSVNGPSDLSVNKGYLEDYGE